ncbi:hypothetical protein JK151_18460 (plasmid) [Ralstonia syzygii subsp. celebesensis]|nr:hypothetical protein [Ralstonia solanacearum]QQV57463.1 hypothetical protein JK151_18460 [Ralstonia syzygii subsp. celebesensis]
MNQQILDELSLALNEGAKNYTVFLHLYQVPVMKNEAPLSYVFEAFGLGAVIGGIEDVQADVVCSEVEESLLFAGDEGAGPSNLVLNSEDFIKLVVDVKREILNLANESSKISKFWLREGHPAYPVFWDFAFMFFGKKGVSILIGSSSD